MIIAGDKDGVQSSFYKRKAFMGVVEFAPNDQLHMLLDAYHSDFKELQTIQRMEYGTWCGAVRRSPIRARSRMIACSPARSPTSRSSVIENYNKDRNAKVDSIGLNTEFKFNDNWSMNADLSWSKVDREDLRLESTAGNGSGNDPAFLPQPETIPFTTGPNGITIFTPTLNYSDYGTMFLTDPGGWGGGLRRSGFVGHPEITDEIQAIRLAASRKLDEAFFLSDVSFGVNYADRTKEKKQFQSNLWLTGNVSHAAVPEQYRTGIADSTFFGSPYGIIGYDALAMYRDGFWQTDQLDRRSERQCQRSRQQCPEHLAGERETHHGVREGRHRHGGRQPAAARQSSVCRRSRRTRPRICISRMPRDSRPIRRRSR